MVRKKPARNRKKEKKGGGWLLVLAVMTFVMAVGMFAASRQEPGQPPKGPAEIVRSIVPSVKKAVTGDARIEKKTAEKSDKKKDSKTESKKDSTTNNKSDKQEEKKQSKLDKLLELLRPPGLEKKEQEKQAEEKQEDSKQVEKQTEDKQEEEKKDESTEKLKLPDPAMTPQPAAPKPAKPEPKAASAKYSGKMAVVIDDCGYDLQPVRDLCQAGGNFSFAILPFKSNSSAALSIIRNNGNVAMLHLPMEPLGGSSSESRSIKVGMTKAEIEQFTKEAVNSLPGISGMNNHQGSKATADYSTMKAVMGVIKQKGLFFVDSRTNAASKGDKVAAEMGISTGRNNRFLDNSSSVSDIKNEIWTAAASADKYGSVIVICHARPATAQAWLECIDDVKAAGIKFVPVTSLLE